MQQKMSHESPVLYLWIIKLTLCRYTMIRQQWNVFIHHNCKARLSHSKIFWHGELNVKIQYSFYCQKKKNHNSLAPELWHECSSMACMMVTVLLTMCNLPACFSNYALCPADGYELPSVIHLLSVRLVQSASEGTKKKMLHTFFPFSIIVMAHVWLPSPFRRPAFLLLLAQKT